MCRRTWVTRGGSSIRMGTDNLETRVLLLAPTGRDAALIVEALARNGINAASCPNAEGLAAAMRHGCGAALITEEALTLESLETLGAAVDAQPQWSDLPVLVLSSSGESTPFTERRLLAFEPLRNVTLIERPVRPATLVSLVHTALRARQRQYEVRRLLEDFSLAEERLRTMIESAQDYAIINLDLNGRITYWNSGAKRLLGYSEQAVIGQLYDLLFPEDDRRSGLAQREMETALATGRAESEGWRVRPDGSKFWASGVVSPIQDSSGKVTGFVKVVRDITDQKNSEERLAQQTKALQRSNEDLQRFAYVASHDLQEPLRMIGSYSQLLVRRNESRLDEDSRQFVKFIVTGVQRMHVLIRDLLEFSRITSDQVGPPEHVDCNQVLGLALQHLQFKITESGAKITFDRLPVVLGHQSRLLQVFQNLIGNALKYCETVPQVHVSAARDREQWRIAITDNGIGIAPEHQEKVFGLFERLHSKSEYPGSGIGLVTCKRIIEQSGGRIWVESALGKGSTFYFTIPAAESQGSKPDQFVEVSAP